MKMPCPICQTGHLQPQNNSVSVRIGENRFVLSDPVHFFECDHCSETIFLGQESKKADLSAAKRILAETILSNRAMNGEDIIFLRAVVELSAKELSLSLNLDPSTVSQWEKRNTVLSFPVSLAVSVLLLKKLLPNEHEFKNEVGELLEKAFQKIA